MITFSCHFHLSTDLSTAKFGPIERILMIQIEVWIDSHLFEHPDLISTFDIIFIFDNMFHHKTSVDFTLRFQFEKHDLVLYAATTAGMRMCFEKNMHKRF